MKCPNCGGEVSVYDLKCPYCGTPNPEGISYQDELTRKQHFNEYLKQEIRRQMALPLAQRWLNLILLFLVLLLILQTVAGVAGAILIDGPLRGLRRPRDYEAQMEQLYHDGAYHELDTVMEEWGVEPADYPVYTQMTLICTDYEYFMERYMSSLLSLDKGELPSEYDLEYTIRYAHELFIPSYPAYPDIYPENRPQLEAYQLEARTALVGILCLTEEEIDLLQDEDYYYSYSDSEKLVNKVRIRLVKEGYVDDGEE